MSTKTADQPSASASTPSGARPVPQPSPGSEAAPCSGTAAALAELLVGVSGFDSFFGTPCGILAPLYASLERNADLHTVPREDAAVGIAAGAATAGRRPAVLMQNSGLGQCVNALASLVVPYRIPMLLIVSLRGTGSDPTPENQVMGRLTEPLLDGLGIPAQRLAADRLAEQAAWAARLVAHQRQPSALLVLPELFGWQA